jgi:hypothetical protein
MGNQSFFRQPNTVGNASMALGIASIALVFGIGFCSLVGNEQGWLPVGATVLYVCGASSAFLGLLAVVLGAVGMFGKNIKRTAAIVGTLLGLGGMCLFFGILAALQNAG